jgi:double-stranded uracil-DNA glycosylase
MARPTRSGKRALQAARPTGPSDRPDRAALTAAHGRTIPDVTAPGLAVLFCGINPGLWSGATGQHFARPGNRFWPALHAAGFTPRRLAPAEQWLLLEHRLGVTNLVVRATARADELSAAELRAGGARLAELADQLAPDYVAVVGVTAYRTAFARPNAAVGPQPEPLASARLWVLPNPSGLNAHYTPAQLAEEFRRLRVAALPGP